MKKKNTTKKALISLFLIAALIITGVFAFLTSKDSKDNVFTMGKVKIELHEDEWYDAAGNLRYDKKVINKTLAELETELTTDGYSVEWDGSKKLVATKDDDVLSYVEEVGADGDTVYESNGINDFAENALPTQKIPKAPYIKNVGKNDTYAYINISIPVVDICLENSNEITEEEIYIPLREDGTEGVNDGWELVFANKGKIVDEQKYNVYVYAYSEEIAPEEQTPPLFSDVRIINFKTVTTPIVEYTSHLYTTSIKEALYYDDPSYLLMASPVVSAMAYTPGQDFRPDTVDEKHIVSNTNSFDFIPTAISNTPTGLASDKTDFYRLTGLVSPEEIPFLQLYIQKEDRVKDYLLYNNSSEVSLSDAISLPLFDEVLASLSIKNKTAFIPFDDGKTYTNTITIKDIAKNYTETTSLEKTKADIVANFGTNKVDLIYGRHKVVADENFYDKFMEVYNAFDESISGDADIYRILTEIKADVLNGIINNNKITIGHAFINKLEDLINTDIDKLLFYNLREDCIIKDKQCSAGLYIPIYCGTEGLVEPYNFLHSILNPDMLSPVIVTAKLTGYENYTGNFNNVSINVIGHGIQTSAGSTPEECYFKGVDEQNWEDRTVNVLFVDTENSSISQIETKAGETIVLPELEPGAYWFKDGEHYEGGSLYFVKEHKNITFIKAIDDVMQYLTFEYSSNKAILVSCSQSIVGDITIPKTIEKDGVIYPVKEIRKGAFVNCPYLYGVTIPSSISNFGSRTSKTPIFMRCPMLQYVNFENNTTSASTFCYFIAECDSLESFKIPVGVQTNEHVISDCKGLKELTIVRNGDFVVERCPYLTSVYFKAPYSSDSTACKYLIADCYGLNDKGEYEGIKLYVGKNASLPTLGIPSDLYYTPGGYRYYYPFWNATPEMVTIYKNECSTEYQTLEECLQTSCYISEFHFENTLEDFQLSQAEQLKKIISLPAGTGGAHGVYYQNEYIDLYPKPMKIFLSNKSGEEYLLQGNYVVTTDTAGLIDYNYITELTVNPGVSSAGSYEGCKNLGKVNMNSNATISSLRNTRPNKNSNQFIIGNNVTVLNSCMDGFKFNELIVPSSVQVLGESALRGGETNRIVFETSDGVGLTTICKEAFAHFVAPSVLIPSTVTTLEEQAFYFINTPQFAFSPDCSITELPREAFYNAHIDNIVFPSGLTTIAESAFKYSELSVAILPSTVSSIGAEAFARTEQLSMVWIPEGCVDIGACLKFTYNSDKTVPFKFYVESCSAGDLWDSNWNRKMNGGAEWPVEYNVSEIPLETSGNTTFIFSDTDKTTLIKCYSSDEIVTIPPSTVEIAAQAFKNQPIVSLIVPDSVTTIHENSFEDIVNVSYNGSADDASNNNWGAMYRNMYDDGNALYSSSDKEELVMVYKLNENNSFDIPDTVVNILDRAFVIRDTVKNNLNSLFIPSNVVSIGSRAFYESSLQNISFAEDSQLSSLGSYVFSYCKELANVTLPSSVTSIPAHAFERCDSFTEINISDRVTTIEEYAFYNIDKITEVVIPDNVQAIGAFAFAVSGLRRDYTVDRTTYRAYPDINQTIGNITVTVGTGLVSLSPTAFDSVFYTVYNSSGNGSYSSMHGTRWEILNFNAKCLTGSIVPNDVSLSSRTYLHVLSYSTTETRQINAKVINIGPDVEKIPANFIQKNYTDAAGVTVNIAEDNSITEIGNGAFSGSGIVSFDIPFGITEIASNTFYNCTRLVSCDIPNSVTTIGQRAFYNTVAIPLINIPSSVEVIEANAFYNDIIEYHGAATGSPWGAKVLNPVLEDGILYSDANKTTVINGKAASGDIVLAPSVTTIYANAFENNSALTSITLPSDLSSLGNNAFLNCTALQSVVLPKATTATSVFMGCTALERVEFTDTSSQQMGKEWFSGCSSLREIVLSNGLTSFGADVFKGCSALSSINIPAGIVSFPREGLFVDCASLLSAGPQGSNCNITYSWTDTIPKYAFSHSQLSTLIISDTIVTIGEEAFAYSKLEKVTIPDTVTTLGDRAFNNSSELKEITLGKGITTLGQYTFEYCPLQKIYYNIVDEDVYFSCPFGGGSLSYTPVGSCIVFGEGVTAIPNSLFYTSRGSIKVERIHIPTSVTSVGSYSFYSIYNTPIVELPEGTPESILSSAKLYSYTVEYY